MGSKDWIKILLSYIIEQGTLQLMKIKNVDNKTRKLINYTCLFI